MRACNRAPLSLQTVSAYLPLSGVDWKGVKVSANSDDTAPELSDAEPETDATVSAPSPIAAVAATQEDTAPLSGTILLGTIIADGRAHALIRSNRGKVTRVKPGDRIGRRTIAAIEQGQVILTRGDTAERMVIPGS